MLLKSFHLFVSSTFKDFARERELLQSTVFPALDTYCAARGYQFHAIDLRWGVNEEAQLDQRTAEICLGEVSAAKGYPAPNFLIMIGDRYGWVPLPFAIAQDEFEAALAWLESQGQNDVVRDLRNVYQLDQNHVISCGLVAAVGADGAVGIDVLPDTSAYTLRSREDEIPELKDSVKWEKVETRLRSALQAAVDHLLQLGRIDTAGRQKYFLSLTEQEIIQGLPGYKRGAALSATGASQPADASGSRAIAWIRQRGASRPTGLLRRLLARSSAQPQTEPEVAALAAAVRSALPEDSVATATTSADPDSALDQAYLDTFVSSIRRKLETAIDAHIAAVEQQQSGPDVELETERSVHRSFAEERRKVFIGRDSNRSAISDYIANSATHPLVLYGPSGSGKSALMARGIADAEANGAAPIVYRFIGASAASSEQRAMLLSLMAELIAHGIAEKPAQWEDDGNKFVAQVRELLSSIAKPVVIFIDALDQLRKPYRPTWLPEQLSRGVKIIISVLDDAAFPTDSAIFKALLQRLPAGAFLEIEPLGATHGHDILVALERAVRRRLEPGQRDYIVGRFMTAGASPLYLRVAFEIARGWRSTYIAGARGHELAANTTALLAQFVDGLSTVYHHERVLVSRTLGYIAATKDGLSASELTAVLSRDADVVQAISSEQHGVRTSRLPVSVWVRLHRHLKAFLVEKRIDGQPLLQFFHRQLEEVAHERFYVGTKAALHGALVVHFDAPVDLTSSTAAASIGRDAVYSRRSLSELPYQLFHAGYRSRLDEILMSPAWMQQKFNAFDSHTLVGDYEQFGQGHTHNLIGRTLRLTARICAHDARQLLPQVCGRLIANSEPAVRTFAEGARTMLEAPALVPYLPSLTPPGAELARLDGHRAGISALAVLPDGTLASGSWDRTIRFWDLASDVEITRFEAHDMSITSLVVMADGCLASGADDGTVRVWDVKTLVEKARLEPPAFESQVHREVKALAALPDGRLVVCYGNRALGLWNPKGRAKRAEHLGFANSSAVTMLPSGLLAWPTIHGRLILWNPRNGTETDVQLEDKSYQPKALAVLPDGRIASASHEKVPVIRIWDQESGAETARLLGHTESINALAALPDGRLASCSWDRTIRLWDLNSGVETASFAGHTDQIIALAVLPNGGLASGSQDRTVRLWDTTISSNTTRLTGHNEPVKALALLPGGLVASGSSDKTVRLWNARSGTEIARLEGHTDIVNALAALHDGRLASGSHDKTIRLWDPNRGTESVCYQALTYDVDFVIALAVLRDGRLVSGAWSGRLGLLDPNSGAQTCYTETKASTLMSMVALPDDRLVSGSVFWCIQLWNHNITDAIRYKLEGNAKRGVASLAVLSDSCVVLGVEDGTVRVWDLKSGTETGRFKGHSDKVTSLAILPHDRLASGSEDKTVRIWELSTGTEICRIEVDGSVNCLISLQNDCLVAGDQMGRLHWLELIQ